MKLNRLLLVLGVVAALSAVWVYYSRRPDAVASTRPAAPGVDSVSAKPRGLVFPAANLAAPSRQLPSVSTPLPPDINQEMRRQYRPLFHQQTLGEIEAVAPALHFSPAITKTLKRWNAAFYEKAQELDRPDVQLDQVYRQLALLNSAHKQAEIRLLGPDIYNRYQGLLSAFRQGTLDQELHPDPAAPKGEVIRSEFVPSKLVQPSAYDALFK